MAKILRAARGFSANGIDVIEGEDVTGKFDGQVLTVLKFMGRVVEDEVSDEEIKGTMNREVKGTKSDTKAPALPSTAPDTKAPALPPLPGV
jgi:hypothetical protein